MSGVANLNMIELSGVGLVIVGLVLLGLSWYQCRRRRRGLMRISFDLTATRVKSKAL